MFCNWIFQWAKKSNLGSFTSQKKTKKYLLTNLVENILITVLLTIKIRFKSPYKKIKVWPLKDISRTVTNFKKLIEQNMFEITRNLLFFLLFASKKEWLALLNYWPREVNILLSLAHLLRIFCLYLRNKKFILQLLPIVYTL